MTTPGRSSERRLASSRFVGREPQLERLRAYLAESVSGRPQVCFVSGAAGSGKTALIRAFIAAAERADETLVTAVGSCNAQTGRGQPYLPFLELLAQLTGEVKAKRAGGDITRAGARRLSELVRVSTRALVEYAPDLIGTLVPGAQLVVKATRYAAEEAGLLKKLEQRAESPELVPDLDEKQIMRQFGRLLGVLSEHRPLVLVLDDLQWVDEASASLLYHLAHSLEDCRILLIGAFRAFPVKAGQHGERHPLAVVLNEIKTRRGDVQIDLDAVAESERRSFMDGLIDLRQNTFDEGFRAALFARTDGLPLFTFELLRELHDRGEIHADAEGCWAAAPHLDWGRTPLRMEGIVEERIARLDENLREILSVASAEGTVFTAQVVARLLGKDVRRLVRTLSQELDQRHGLVQEGAMIKIGGEWRSEFRFTSTVFQQHVYGAMTRTEKVLLHAEIASTVEELYGVENESIVALLARQYELGGEAEKAIQFLLAASRIAEKMRSFSSVLKRFNRALALLGDVADETRRRELELSVRLAGGHSLMVTKGYGDSETWYNFERASGLCRREQKPKALFQALLGLWQCALARGEVPQARATGEELLALAKGEKSSASLALAHRALGESLMFLGDLVPALEEFDAGIEAALAARRTGGISAAGTHPEVACLCSSAWTRCLLGFADRASTQIEEARKVAAEISPFQEAAVLAYETYLWVMRREMDVAASRAREVIALSATHGFPDWDGVGRIVLAASLAWDGGHEEHLAEMHEAIARFRAATEATAPFNLALEAELRLRGGQLDAARGLLEEADAVAVRTGEHWWDAEIARLSGEMSLLAGDGQRAEERLESARLLAAQQHALAFELRATASLARLLAGRGEKAPAREMMESVLGRFTEGSSTPDQQDARSLLADLA